MIDLKIVCEDEKYLPTYATSLDACMDLKLKIDNSKAEKLAAFDFNDGYSTEHYQDTIDTTHILPNEQLIFGTGIKVFIPENHVMLIFPRSSTGIKLQCMLSNLTGIIDSGYRDEIKVTLFNFGKYPIVLKDGQRIAQFMIIPRPQINLIEVEDNEEFRKNDRGGGVGSTGKI